MRRIAVLLVAVALPWPAFALKCRALDGDTLQCGAERVRLYDVYAAEMNEAGGAQARRNLQQRLRGHEVTLHRHGHDRYGRTLADAYVGGHKIVQSDVGPRAGRGTRSGYASRPK